MKIYGIVPKTITYYGKEVQMVLLGENGRGRRMLYVPFQGEFLRDAADYEVIKEIPSIVRTGTPTEGWIAVLSGDGPYTRGTHGTVYVLKEYLPNVELVEYGYGGFGEAGGIGDWWEYLVLVKEPAIFLVRPAGGSDKRQRYYLIFKDRWAYEVFPEELALAKNALGLYDLENPNTLVKAYKDGDRDRLVELKDLRQI